MRAAVYLRISDDRESRELDIERQRADCLKLAGTLGVDVVEVYQDNDPSAFLGIRTRPAYRRMLADAGARHFGTVIAYTSGRLAHRPEEYEDLIELAQRHGTRFAYVVSASSYAEGRYDPPGASPLLPVVSALDTFRRLAGELAPDLKGLVSDAAPVVEPLAEGLAGFVRNALPGLRGLVRESTPFVTELSRSLPPLGHALGRFLGSVSPGAPGASAFVGDVVALASGQALFWGEVVRRMSQAYLAARGLVADLDEAFAALPERTRDLVMNLFDQATTGIGIGIGSALRSHGWTSLPDLVRQRLNSTLDAGNTAASALVGAATDMFASLPGRLGRTAGYLGGSAWVAASRLRDEVGDIVDGVVSGTGSAASLAVTIADRAVSNIVAGVKTGLAAGGTDDVAAWTPIDKTATHAIRASVDVVATPGGITVNGLNVNLYGVWDPTDSEAVDRVVAGIYEALNRRRWGYA